MLSTKDIICPENLLKIAKTKGPAKAVIVNAVKPVSIESAKQAVDANLIIPVFIGDKSIIEKNAKQLNWDISKYEIINEPDENSTAPIAAKLASEGKVKIIVKGHIHTDVLMKAVLKRDLNLIGKKRLSHIWHMTLEKNDKPFIITDGALNVLPKLETKMHILKNAIDFTNRIGIEKPKVSILSATEEVLDSVPSSLEASELTKRAKEEGLKITCDTAPPYFILNEMAIENYKTFTKLSPPLRTEKDRISIIEGLQDGTIDAIASDHMPQDQDAKRLPFNQAEYGAVGLETLLPLSISLVKNNFLSIEKVFSLITTNPAKIMNLDSGKIKVGNDADIMIFNEDKPWKINPDEFHSKSKNTPFDGMLVEGKNLMTFVRGRLVYKNL